METTIERCRTPRDTNAAKLGRMTRSSQKAGAESLPSNTWPSEKLPQCHLRQNMSSSYGRDFSSDQNLKSPVVKSSEESILNGDIAEQINYPEYEEAADLINVREKSAVPQDLGYKLDTHQSVGSSYRENYPNPLNPPTQSPIYRLCQRQLQPGPETGGGGMLQAIAAEQKLQKLKELQRNRELTERYYSQEIRKLITEYYRSSSGNAGDSLIQNKMKIEKPIGASPVIPQQQQQQQQLCTLAKKSPRTLSPAKPLEPCGTMTTITRLDCGCMQETTRPIFTTPEGRVENRNCRHGQDPALLRLAPANPHEHLSPSHCIENRERLALHGPSGPRLHRSGILYPKIVTRSSCPRKRAVQAVNLRYESGHGRAASFTGKIDPRRPETVSSSFLRNYREARNVSPLRKYSDTSTD